MTKDLNEPAIVQPALIDSVAIKGGVVKLVLVMPIGATNEALEQLVRFNREEQPCLLTLSALQARLGLEVDGKKVAGD